MSKPGKRPGRKARDAYNAIRRQVAELEVRARDGQVRGPNDERYPDLSRLVSAFESALRAAAPRSIELDGQTYWTRVYLQCSFDLFDSPTAPEPLTSIWVNDPEPCGHTPGH